MWINEYLQSKSEGFPKGSVVKTCQWRRHRFDPWAEKISWRRKWQVTPGSLPGEYHGQRSLVGWGHKELDMTERLSMYTCPNLNEEKLFPSLSYTSPDLWKYIGCLCGRAEQSIRGCWERQELWCVAFWSLGGEAGCIGKAGGSLGVHSAREDDFLQLLGFNVPLLSF